MLPLALLPVHYPPQAVDKPTLEYYQDYFVLRRGRDAWREPINPPEPPPVLVAAFRRNQNFAVWDERGLTVRRGDRVLTSTLGAVPTSPRLFSREEILQTSELIQAKKRSRAAAGLSGSMRIGGDVYFLVRWDGSDGKAWAEALVKVDLNGTSLKPEVIGRFEGLSVAYRPIDDRLIRIGEHPSIVARTPDTWGTASYDLKTKTFSYRPLGSRLQSFYPIDRNDSLFVEASPYGTTLGGHVDLESGVRRNQFELRANGRYLDVAKPNLIITSNGSTSMLRNGETGVEARIPNGASVRRVGPFAVVFAPAKNPRTATIYSLDRLEKVGDWSQKEAP